MISEEKPKKITENEMKIAMEWCRNDKNEGVIYGRTLLTVLLSTLELCNKQESTIRELQGQVEKKGKRFKHALKEVKRLKGVLRKIKTYKESFTKTPNDRFLYSGVVHEATKASKEEK